jgi:hypothetical protein
MVTIAHNVASALKSLVTSATARLSGLFGRRRAPQPARPHPQTEGAKARDAQEKLVETRRKNTGMAMQTLRSSLKSGKITQEEYSARVAQLSEIQTG